MASDGVRLCSNEFRWVQLNAIGDEWLQLVRLDGRSRPIGCPAAFGWYMIRTSPFPGQPSE